MTYYDEQLRQLQARCSRKRQLEAQVRELNSQHTALEEEVGTLREIMLDEQADVDRLEGCSLAAFYYNVIGKMDEQLTKEREEAYAAKVKYDAAARELDAVEDDLQRSFAELETLQDCESRYTALLKEKADAMKAAGGTTAEDILRLEERLAFLSSQREELDEAIKAGNTALNTAQNVLSSLDSAEGWGTWDLFGGGLISDMAKYSHLDDAQNTIELLQSQLRRFKTELADVTIHADMRVDVSEFLHFADYFFDGLFADWAVLDRINDAQNQVRHTYDQIEDVLSKLHTMVGEAEREYAEVKQRRETLVLGTQI